MIKYCEEYVSEKVAEIVMFAGEDNIENALVMYHWHKMYQYLNGCYEELADKVSDHFLKDIPLDKDEILADIQVGMYYRDNPSEEAKEIDRRIEKIIAERWAGEDSNDT